ncbi:cytochrome-c peroxidase [Aliikangiella coralliicola]|uniref:Cytochrome-c peroxidase n=1 Tax=Aliikangiella coralliicola TaxID=2592383 RepID=A0A545U6S3_9GAMM|nr:cytochrome-c peroxidase [Aliikangiella coralliicola]
MIVFSHALSADSNLPIQFKTIPATQNSQDDSAFTLSVNCPPGFENIEQKCHLRSLYQQYDSLYDKGVGGLKTALPTVRDGFSPQQIDLGRLLFFDPLLSGDNTLSCASCHEPDKGFSDGLPRSIGANQVDVGRASPTLWNVAFLSNFFWDSRAHSLEEQMLGPLYSEKEMATTPVQLINELNNNKTYQRLFRQAFPNGQSAKITLQQIYTSITAFEASLISLNSRYDHYAHGYHQALTENEIEGLNIFRSFVARCAECHTPPLFTNQQIAVLGSPEPPGRELDIGAEKTFNNPDLRAGFKVPSLRNIVKTAPYMHSGRFENLRDTVEFYTKGRGHAVPEGEKLLLHWHIWEPDLTERELDRLVDFLGTLTDESFTPKIPQKVPSGLPVNVGQNITKKIKKYTSVRGEKP